MCTHLSEDDPRRHSVAQDWAQLSEVVAAIDSHLDKWLRDAFHVGLTEYRALSHLSRAQDKELRIAELAARVGLTSTSTTRLVSRLEATQRAFRDVCEDDGRGVFAVIDEAGEKLLSTIGEAYDRHLQEMLSRPSAYTKGFDPAAASRAMAWLVPEAGA